jgi:hypothetical protein
VGWTLAAGSNLPAGISLSATGLISGTPTHAGNFRFTVEAVDASNPQQIASTALNLVVSGVVTITTNSVPSGTIGQPYNRQLQASGGTKPYSWEVSGGTLPTGLLLSTDGLLSGTPTLSGFFFFTVTVTDSSTPTKSSSTSSYLLSINTTPGAFAVVTMFLLPARVGSPYGGTLTAANGTPPYSWSIASGSLPTGVTLAGNGTLSGTPTAAGTYTFVVKATDNTAAIAEKQLAIVVRP